MSSRKRPLLRAADAVLTIALCVLWTLFATSVWGGGRIVWSGIEAYFSWLHVPVYLHIPSRSWLYRLLALFSDRGGCFGISAYLHLGGFLCAAFLLTVLLPDTLRRLFPGRKRLLTVYRIAAAAVLLAVLLCLLEACTTLFSGVLPLALRGRMVAFYTALLPACLLVGLLGWVLPCALRRLSERKRLPLQRDLRRGLARTLCCLAAALVITSASCLLLALLRPRFPGAVSTVLGFCGRFARSDSECFILLILAPLLEELCFRGLIQRQLRRSLPAWGAILLSSLLFAFWHRNLGQFVYTFFCGAALGWIYERGGKLRYSALTHFLMNLFAAFGFSERPTDLFGKLRLFPWLKNRLIAFSPVPAALLFLALAALLIVLLRRFPRREAAEDA